ncbi:GTPase family protein [Psychrobacter sp. I-STPA6b]|uniref:GTPase family protein n=1 Tax=Psychrobacter sp. I-STPA6b TaxID=2585718 RepID=UPI001D0C4EA6|nr:GTPase [Psychrobacter sp. I-STPA6b]
MRLDDFKAVIRDLATEHGMSEKAKQHLMLSIQKLADEKINILVTGATGCGKSSTINALFGENVAKVGQGVDPETMDIKKFELNNIILWDSPGLGDGKEADRRHSKNIINKLYEKDKDGNALIDLVLVILDGSSRDLGTSFELINQVIIPNLGEDTNRLLVAINQCDMAMKGRYWDHEKNKPENKLVEFLDEKVESTRKRIHEATGVNVEPIYYSAGYKDGDEEQQPYNLSKLFMFIVNSTKPKKRAVYINDMNIDKKVWEHDDKLQDYQKEVQQSFIDSIRESAQTGGEIGEEIGSLLGSGGRAVGRVIGTVVGGAVGVVKSFFSGLFG